MNRVLVWVLEILLFIAFLFVWAWAWYPLFLVIGGVLGSFGIPAELGREISAVFILAVPASVFVIWMLRRVDRKKTKDVKDGRPH